MFHRLSPFGGCETNYVRSVEIKVHTAPCLRGCLAELRQLELEFQWRVTSASQQRVEWRPRDHSDLVGMLRQTSCHLNT
eukprot:1679616-Rhodomonas_salina.2